MEIKILNRKIDIKREFVVLAAIILAAGAGAAGYLIKHNGGTVIVEKAETGAPAYGGTSETGAKTGTGAEKERSEAREEETQIKIYVTGCVRNPGIVTLKKGQLIDDAINAAGGATADADLANINLVYRLDDNLMINVKPKIKNGEAQNPRSPSSAPESEAGPGVELVKDGGDAIVNGVSQGKKGERPVDINSATAEELDSLPGIGKGLANDIVAFRQKNGKFKSKTDIMKIPGIKQSKYDKIKDFITAK